jgi:hypothetical protein
VLEGEVLRSALISRPWLCILPNAAYERQAEVSAFPAMHCVAGKWNFPGVEYVC